ncbi:hypothetical protein AAE478_008256 [Parahypoxylon ruwenzoriense]
MAFRLTSLLRLPVWLLIGQVSCGSIAAWWNTRGPSFILQDDDTGGIRYSLCNGNHTPIFPDDSTITAPFASHLPKKNTSLSATGWTDDETAWASVFYLDTSDEIVNALLRCNWTTGRWQNRGEWVISGGAPKIAPDSGLSAVLLGSKDGYRVFYNDLQGNLHHIGYTSNTAWAYYGVVSHDSASSQAIGSTFSPKSNNISIVRPRDAQNMGVSRLYADNLWHISSFPQPLNLTGNHSTNATAASDIALSTASAPPFTLPAWDGNASAVAVAVDSDFTRSIFYIGTDRKLYQVGNKNYTWSVFPRPEDAAWPDADVAGAHIGVASDFGSSALRLYYVSGGRVVEVTGDGGVWQTATVLPTFNASNAAAESSATPSSSETAIPAASGTGLSDGAKAGIGVGVTLGVVAIGGMLFALWFLRRRQRRLDAAAAAGEHGSNKYASPGSAYAAPAGSSVRGGYAPIPSPSQVPSVSPPPTAATPTRYTVSSEGYSQGDGGGVGGMTYSSHDGGWVYAAPPAAAGAPVQPQMQQVQQQQGGYYYQQPQPQPQFLPQELPDQRRPVEMMGEGHYKEVP